MSTSVLAPNSIVLVTGANGLLGSHVTEQLLKAGYKVRGTARSAAKLAPLQERWEKLAPGQFEAVVVEDLVKEDALLEALKDVSAITHVASDVSFGTSYEQVVEPVVRMTKNILATAKKIPSIKRFVLTSSSVATITQQGAQVDVDESTWNEESKIKAKGSPDDDPLRAVWVYSASKTEGEQAAWAFVEAEKPHFEFNSVLPVLVVGPIFDASQSGSTAGFIKALFNNDKTYTFLPPQHYVSAEDTALLHLGALTLPSVVGRRIIASAAPFNWDAVLAIFRKLYPSRTFVEDFQSGKDLTKYDNAPGAEILKQLGRAGWEGLEESVESIVGRE